MKLRACLSSIVFFVYCSAVVLVIVNGKTATQGGDDKTQVAALTAELSQAVGRNSKLENLLAASVNIMAELKRNLGTTSGSRSNTTTGDQLSGCACTREVLQLRTELALLKATLSGVVQNQSKIVNDNRVLTNEVQSLRAEVGRANDRMVIKIAQLNASMSSVSSGGGDGGVRGAGATYVRWGRKTCDSNTSLLYAGHAAGPHWEKGGSGRNFLCLPENPQWRNYIDGQQQLTGYIYGIEYELHNSGTYRNNIFSETNNGGNPLAQNPASCAVCYTGGRSTTLMIPARTQCPSGWTTEYSGYLVSDWSNSNTQPHDTKRSNYVCLDEAPQVASSGGSNQNQAGMHPVEVGCGTLPCSTYSDGRELACIVCSK